MSKKTIGLLAIVTTLCVGGIFTVNAAFNKKEPAKAVTTYYYGNDGNGNYRLLTQPPNLENCTTPAATHCVLVSSEQITEGFTYLEKPDDAAPMTGSDLKRYTGN